MNSFRPAQGGWVCDTAHIMKGAGTDDAKKRSLFAWFMQNFAGILKVDPEHCIETRDNHGAVGRQGHSVDMRKMTDQRQKQSPRRQSQMTKRKRAENNMLIMNVCLTHR